MIAAAVVFLLLLTVPTGQVAVSAPVAPGADEIAAKLDMGFARGVIEDLTSIGSTSMGFRVAGTPEDLATATYITRAMSRIGLEDVHLEQVPVDAWLFKGASVAVSGPSGAKTYDAGSQGGVPGTPRKGLSGEVVFAGEGTALDYERLGLDATGKIVLAWWNPSSVWTNHMAYEAQARGAKALIVSTPPGGAYYQAEGAIGSFDATCDPNLCVPFVTISTRDAQQILGRLQAGEKVTATVTLKAEIKYGATGYNTYGKITGSVNPNKVIVFGAHHDAWWYGAVDDTSGVATVLALAKAVKASGYQPRYTWVFTTHTGEEYGLADAYYDWLIGAWWRITHAHTEWQTSAVAFVNFEGQGYPANMRANVAQELRPLLHQELGRSMQLLPYGTAIFELYSWNEAWTFGAAGVPSITFSSFDDVYTRTIYHTQFDTIDKIDFGYLRNLVTVETRFSVALDQAVLLPYDFSMRVSTLGNSLDYTLMEQLGYGRADRKALKAAYDRLSAAWGAVARLAYPADVALYNTHLREAARVSLQDFTALSAWDYTIYPHQQVENDAYYLGLSIADLEAGKWKSGLRYLEWWVAQSWYIPRISKMWFQHEMSHHDTAYAKIAWGGQGHLAPYLDLWQTYKDIEWKALAGNYDFADEIAALESIRANEVALYHERLDALTASINTVAWHLEQAAKS